MCVSPVSFVQIDSKVFTNEPHVLEAELRNERHAAAAAGRRCRSNPEQAKGSRGSLPEDLCRSVGESCLRNLDVLVKGTGLVCDMLYNSISAFFFKKISAGKSNKFIT
jgi:hypothetical protein